MKLIIDIPDDDYEFIEEQVDVGYCNDVRQINNRLYHYIAKGTIIPKGHGDLKDVDEIERIWKKGNYVRSALLFAPTVIEADKGEEDGNNITKCDCN